MGNVELRVVGGWCRDKLLGLDADDIDVAVRGMSGRAFAEKLCEAHQATSYKVVSVNPAQSKHLETAVLQFQGHRLDFTHLRKERYDEESRIPTVQFGSPLEDAMRRDLTINALCYNLDTWELEDPCGMGLSDVEKGIIRTPCEPSITLQEDPLRVLRILRFSSLLNFTIEPKLMDAMLSPQVMVALRTKVSRERIRIEFDKMMLLHRQGYCRALALCASIPGLLECALAMPNDEPRFSILDVPQCEVPLEVESSVTSEVMLLAARTASLLLVRPEKSLERVDLEQVVWSTQRSKLVARLIEGVRSLRALWKDAGKTPTDVQMGLWARACGQDILHASILLAGVGQSFLENPFLVERAFLRPIVPGHILEQRYSLKGREIGALLNELIAWQMSAKSLTAEDALLFLDGRQQESSACLKR